MEPTNSPLLKGLNADQQKAVITTEGPVLVVAGPGSGKTRVLTHRIGYLIQERGVPPQNILAVTFTNKAAREMRERVDALVGAEETDGLVMGTFHALGVRILRQNPGTVAEHLQLLPNFVIYDDSDQMEMAKAAIRAAGLDPKQITPRRMLSRISRAKAELMSPTELAEKAGSYGDEIVIRVYQEYEKLLKGANAVDFDDLLGLPIRLFDEDPDTLARYQQQFHYIMVDEYQDTNRVQYVMVSALAERFQNLFVVGDPDQSIYTWRQADIRNILDFESDYPDLTQIHLELNYRSTQRIVQAADRVIQDNFERIPRRITTNNPEGELIQVRELPDQQAEASWIVSEIRRLTARDELRPEEIAVMYRTTAQSRVLEEAFRMSGFRYRIVGGVRFYDRKEVRDIIAVLRVLYNPRDTTAMLRIVDHFPIGHGFGPKAMETAQEWAATHNRGLVDAFTCLVPSNAARERLDPPAYSRPARSAAIRIGTAFAILQEHQQEKSLSELFDSIIDVTDYKTSFNTTIEEELQRWGNVQELRTDLEQYDHFEPATALPTYLERVALIADADTMADENQGDVTLITLHSAKGLEFPVVFIAGAEEGLLPIHRAIEAEAYDRAPMEEERRLFYVGITRAMKKLYITYAQRRMTYGQFHDGSVSRFVSAIPAETVHRVTRDASLRRSSRGREFNRPMAGSYTQRVSSPGVTPKPVPEKWTDGPTIETQPPAPTPHYAPGDVVFHPRFGEGVVAEVADRRGGDQEVAVVFRKPEHGTKRLIASLAKMDFISSGAETNDHT